MTPSVVPQAAAPAPARDGAFPRRGTALLMALVAALLCFRLGVVPLLGPDEPRYARVAVEMHRTGDLVTPTLQGKPWLEKPPLYYWLAGAAFAALGETEAAARLPSVAAALLLVGAVVFVGARLHGGAAGLHGGFVAGTSLIVFAYGRAAAMDMLLAATVTAGVGLLGLRLVGAAPAGAVTWAYAFLGLATLAKGPLGLLLPGLVVIGYVASRRDWSLLRLVVSARSVLALLAVAGPWYAAITAAQGRAFVDVFLLDHNVSRFTSTIHNHPGPVYYYLPVLLAGFFPWSGLLVPALAGSHPVRSQADRFVWLWLLLPLLFFSAAGSKLPGYILPCLAPLAVLGGRAADDLVHGRARATRAAAIVGLILGALIVTAPLHLRGTGEPSWRVAIAPAAWALVVVWLVSRRLSADGDGALRLLRVGAAGFLLLIAQSAPPLLARRESGRDLFVPARGREVLSWGAWRTAWMAGYFYNDGNVREVASAEAIAEAAARGPVLALCGPAQRRMLEAWPSLSVRALAEGPRENALLRVERR
jgi:4-amino-4-deoxy-L-arabinose transferase-like glycosyltransferase